jgi:flagella synthesis protein FlgN
MTIERKTLASHITTECQILGQLTVLLREEQLALVRGQIEALASYSDPKARLLIELSRCADERAQLLTENGLPANAAGMDQLLRMLEHDASAVIADWQRLLDDTRATRQLNDINGTLIASRMRGTQQALGVLLTAARIPGTYAADGTTVGAQSAHRLAVA